MVEQYQRLSLGHGDFKRRNRMKEERAQAEQVVVSQRLSMRAGEDTGADVTIYVHNTSPKPIRLPMLIASGGKLKAVVRDLKQAGGGQDQLIETLRGMREIPPQIHEGLAKPPNPLHPIDVIPADGQRTLIVKLPLPLICYTYEFCFHDAKGIYWIRDVVARKLFKAKGEPRLKRWPREAGRRIASAFGK
jgi:hypothetical protein